MVCVGQLKVEGKNFASFWLEEGCIQMEYFIQIQIGLTKSPSCILKCNETIKLLGYESAVLTKMLLTMEMVW